MGFISFFREIFGLEPEFLRIVDVFKSKHPESSHSYYGISTEGNYFVKDWYQGTYCEGACNSSLGSSSDWKEVPTHKVPEKVMAALATNEIKRPYLERHVIKSIAAYSNSSARDIRRCSSLNELGINTRGYASISFGLRWIPGIKDEYRPHFDTVGDILDFVNNHADIRRYVWGGYPEIVLE